MSTSQETRINHLSKSFGSGDAGKLKVGQMSVGKLANRVSTPCFVYSGDSIVERIKAVRNALGRENDLYYSIKANPSLGICQLIAREGVGAEAASIGELILAQKAGFPAQKTIFAGPGKTDEELELAVRLGIFAVNVESAGEMQRLACIARKLRKPVQVSLRINPAGQLKGSQMRMGGGPQQFGIDEEQLEEFLDQFHGDPFLDFIGLHVYAGTQVFEVDALLEHCRHVAGLGQRLSTYLEQPLEMLDFGGGFGVPYFEDSPEFDLQAFGDGFRQINVQSKANPGLAYTRRIIELGRYLVAEAGVYITRVVDVKQSRGKTFVVTDGGMNHHIMATGNFGQVFRKPYPIALVDSLGAPADKNIAIVGPCCTPLDTFAKDITFPQVEVGDLIGVFCSGAYGYSASSLAFLSHPTPAEVMVWGDRVYILRAPGTPDQVLDGQYGVGFEGELACIA